MNSANYFLTENGVISKLDSYWDKLESLTTQLENATKHMAKKLFNSFIGTMLFIVIIFWLNLEYTLGLTLLALVILGAISLAATQLNSFMEFMDLKKKGMILYEELNRELEQGFDELLDEEISVEERIILSNFLLACELPMNTYLYLALLGLLPLISLGLFIFYYLHP